MALVECPKCGMHNLSGTKICTHCGFDIAEDERNRIEMENEIKKQKEEDERRKKEKEQEETRKKVEEQMKKNGTPLDRWKTTSSNESITPKIQNAANSTEVRVDSQNLTGGGLVIPLTLINRVILAKYVFDITVYVVGSDNKLIKKFKIADSAGNSSFISALSQNIRLNGGEFIIAEAGQRLCAYCYHVIPGSDKYCPYCHQITGAAFDKNENGYKCPSCGRMAGHPIKSGRKMLSIGFLGLASNTVGKTYQCHSCGYMW